MIIGALIASLAFSAALLVALIWQMKRAASAMDKLLAKTEERAEQRILLAAGEVALADKERAMDMVIAERDRLEFALDTVEDQRDALLEESLKHATPSTIAISVRDALQRLRPTPPLEASEAEDLLDMPSS